MRLNDDGEADFAEWMADHLAADVLDGRLDPVVAARLAENLEPFRRKPKPKRKSGGGLGWAGL